VPAVQAKSWKRNVLAVSLACLLLGAGVARAFFFCDIICMMQLFGISRVDRFFDLEEYARKYVDLKYLYPCVYFGGSSGPETVLGIDSRLALPQGDTPIETMEEALQEMPAIDPSEEKDPTRNAFEMAFRDTYDAMWKTMEKKVAEEEELAKVYKDTNLPVSTVPNIHDDAAAMMLANSPGSKMGWFPSWQARDYVDRIKAENMGVIASITAMVSDAEVERQNKMLEDCLAIGGKGYPVSAIGGNGAMLKGQATALAKGIMAKQQVSLSLARMAQLQAGKTRLWGYMANMRTADYAAAIASENGTINRMIIMDKLARYGESGTPSKQD
jgi:hypothetical protein